MPTKEKRRKKMWQDKPHLANVFTRFAVKCLKLDPDEVTCAWSTVEQLTEKYGNGKGRVDGAHSPSRRIVVAKDVSPPSTAQIRPK